MRIRLKHAHDWKLYFWTWKYPMFYASTYYDGWNNQINFGLFCICWWTPPLKGDFYDDPRN